MANHNVKLSIERKKLKYDKYCVEVERGDTITWKMDAGEAIPFVIMVKACISPLVWSFAVSEKDKKALVGTVRSDAEPGHYRYGACAWDGKNLIVDDPDIIVKPPKGGK
jgi:plastocyanin